jgi:hypothetical protein
MKADFMMLMITENKSSVVPKVYVAAEPSDYHDLKAALNENLHSVG